MLLKDQFSHGVDRFTAGKRQDVYSIPACDLPPREDPPYNADDFSMLPLTTWWNPTDLTLRGRLFLEGCGPLAVTVEPNETIRLPQHVSHWVRQQMNVLVRR